MSEPTLKIIYWDGDRSLLPSIPRDDRSQKEIEAFERAMDTFLERWQPLAPEGKNWRLIEKVWLCDENCSRCATPALDSTKPCKYQGVRLKSKWGQA